jgi:hypothetical protein
MPEFELRTPVAFIIFNRPDTTERVFAEIARARPPMLLVVGDGPRANREGEMEKVAAARAIIERVDWPCEVLTHYSDVNLGCKVRVSSGLDWVFEQVPEAIILEDDCLPHPTFFRFCEEMLVRYREDQRIAMISGDNFLNGSIDIEDSYYFSRYLHIWGWATWRRAWKNYDVNMSNWPKMAGSGFLESTLYRPGERYFWGSAFDAVYKGAIDTWDYQWVFSAWAQNQLSIMPNVNLISNIGFGVNATHTIGDSVYASLNTSFLVFPVKHPNVVLANFEADRLTAAVQFSISFKRRIFNHLKAFVKKYMWAAN